MYRRPRGSLLVLAAVLAVVMIGVYGVDRAMVAFVGVGPLSFLRVPLPAVRDGLIVGGERQVAVAAAEDLAGQLPPSGSEPAGTATYASCLEGHNSWKSQDGYRLSCSAGVVNYSSWSGDFEAMRDAARAELSARCAGPDLAPLDQTPRAGMPIDLEVYACDGAIEVEMGFGATEGLLATDSVVLSGEDSDETRHISGPGPDDLVSALSKNQWFVVYKVHQTYYQDQP